MAIAALSPAAAQSWSVGVGVGVGGPAYYGPPPVYYGAPPPYVYEQPPVVYMPAPTPQVRSSVSPDAVFDLLDRAGYRELSPMAFRDGVYKLNAVNRRGDLVALEVSALDGRVEREFILSARHRVTGIAPPARTSIPAPPPTAPAPQPSSDPLVVY